MSHNASLEVGRKTCLGCLMKNSSDLGNHCKLVTTGDRKEMYIPLKWMIAGSAFADVHW